MHAQEYDLKPSKIYLVSLSFLIIGTLLALVSLPWRLPFKGLAIISLLIYGGYLLQNDGLLRGKWSIRRFKKLGEGVWQLNMSKQTIQAELLGDSTITRFVAILRFRVPGKYQPVSCVIFNDALAKDRYHALLMQIKS